MNPTFKEYAIDFEDLKLLSIVCKQCKTEMIVDVAGQDILFPDLCPYCRS